LRNARVAPSREVPDMDTKRCRAGHTSFGAVAWADMSGSSSTAETSCGSPGSGEPAAAAIRRKMSKGFVTLTRFHVVDRCSPMLFLSFPRPDRNYLYNDDVL